MVFFEIANSFIKDSKQVLRNTERNTRSIFTRNLFMKKLLLPLVALFALACKQKERSGTPETVFLKSETMNVSEHLGRAFGISSVGSYLIIRDDQVDTKLTIFNMENDPLVPVYTGQAGQGPRELANPGPIIPDSNRFLIYDRGKMKLLSCRLDNIASPDHELQEDVSIGQQGIIDMKKISPDVFFAVGVFPENRFMLFDGSGKTIGKLGSYPVSLGNDPEYVRGIACQSMLATHTEKRVAAVAMRYGEHIQFYAFGQGGDEPKLLNERSVFLPEYTTNNHNGSPNFSPTEKTRWGYLSISSDTDYVYALYSGKLQAQGTDFYRSHVVHVFDWEGNFVRIMELDRDVSSITICQNWLYALYVGEKGYDLAKYPVK